ncbi:MAG TPA: zf-HC2 domain-containing protein [Thermoanaerobaculia bacterium]|nr:zf-HC2 domain-containing protein [Thermoanaerobaculia bacterium]
MSDREHHRLRELLPWYVAGALDEEEQARCVGHLERCAECRDAVAEEVALREAVRATATPRLAPHPTSFRRVLEVIETAGSRGLVARARRLLAGPLLTPRRLRLAALVIAQNVALVLIVLALARPAEEAADAPRFETRAVEDATSSPRLRLVFREDVALWEIVDLLRELDLELVGGPSAVGAFEIAIPAGRAPASVAAALRRDARVRLVAGAP